MRLWKNRAKCNQYLAVALLLSAAGATGQDLSGEAWRLESRGDG